MWRRGAFLLACVPVLAMAEGNANGRGAQVAQAAPGNVGGKPTGQPGTVSMGRVLQRRAVLPTKMAEVMTLAADMMEAQARWVGTTPEAARKEHDLMVKSAREHRELAKSFRKVAETMTKGGDLPAVMHPTGTPEMARAMELEQQLASAEREVSQLLLQDAQEAEQRMRSMREGAGGN